MWLGAIVEALQSVVFASPCPVCATGGFGGRLCDACYRELPRLDRARACATCDDPLPHGGSELDRPGIRCAVCLGGRHFDRARALGTLDGTMRELVHAVKYGARQSLGYDLGRRIGAELRTELGELDLVAPIPLARGRRRERGFDQALVIAQGVAKSLRLPLLAVLRRNRETSSQTTLSRAGRRRNVAGAFSAVGVVSGRRVLLVDDVLTTGATADEAARCIRRAGATEVSVLTVARAGESSTDFTPP